MGRPERQLDPSTGPLADFAVRLRKLRVEAGGPSYRELARRTNYAVTTLSDAAGGKRLPSLEVTLAFVAACGGDRAEWEERWRTVKTETAAPVTSARSTGLAGPDPDSGDTAPDAPPSPGPGRWRQRGLVTVAVAGGVLALVASGGLWAAGVFEPERTGSAAGPAPSPSAWRMLDEVMPDQKHPDDAMDPIRAGCGSPDVAQKLITLDEVPVFLPGGEPFGRLALRHNPTCQMSWGLVIGPHTPSLNVHITARRPADATAVSSSFSGTYPSSYGDMLRTTSCVYVEAYVETAGGTGPVAATSCR